MKARGKAGSLPAQAPDSEGAAAGGDGATGGQGAPARGDKATDGLGADTRGKGARAEQSSGVGASSPDTEGEAPPHRMHANLLTFALFGPLSRQNDTDVSLSPSGGPTRTTSPASRKTVEATSRSELRFQASKTRGA